MKLNLHTSLKHKNDDMKTSLLKKRRKLPLLATLLLFVGLTAPVTGWGQQTLTVYENETTTNNYIPLYGFDGDYYQKTEFIIPASELQAMIGGTISQMAFYITGTNPTKVWGPFKVFLKEVTNTTLSAWSGDTGATTVYTGNFDGTSGTVNVVFNGSTPSYTYNGGNLLVGVYLTTTDGQWNSASFLGKTVTGASGNGYNNSALENCTFTQQNFIPKTTFTYSIGPTWTGTSTGNYYISNFNVSDGSTTLLNNTTTGTIHTNNDYYNTQSITAKPGDQLTCVITCGASGTYGYAVWVDFDGDGLETDDKVFGTSSYQSSPYTGQFTIPANTPDGEYRLRVLADYNKSVPNDPNGSYSNGEAEDYKLIVATNAPTITGVNNITNTSASVSWTGNNDSYIVQYVNLATATPSVSSETVEVLSQGFEGGSLPTGWTNEGSSSWTVGQGDASSSATHSGSYNAKITHGTTGNVTYFVSPVFDLSAYANPKLTCWYMNHSWGDDIDGFGVYYRTSSSGAWVELFSTTSANSSWTQTSQLSLPSEAYVQVGFKYTDNYGYGVGLDDILITANPYEYTWTTASNNATSPYTLGNLTDDTEYLVRVIGVCNGFQSDPSNVVSFTTEAGNCPAPTSVTASNITVNSAHISWNGEADSYNVRYATATVTGTTLETVFFDDFENGFGNWTTYALGDYTDDTWALTNSTSLVDNYHSGSYGALTRSYYNGVDVSVDNWLVSPQMTLGDVLKFWVVGDDNNYQEYFAVYVSTETNAASDFVMLEAPELAPGDGTWAERTVDLSAYAGQVGYIAIRHTDFAQDFLILDDFGVYNTVNAYSYGTFTTLPPTTETSCDITGLSPETLYVAQVQADCGDPDGTSGWSSVYFTTPDACSAPTDLVTSNITATTATLGWSDNQDSYNVQYRKVYFFEGFEGETLPTGWTTIDANEDGNTWGIFHVTTHSGNNGAANLSYIYGTEGTTPDDYLVSPQLDLQGTLRVWLSGITASTNAEHFEILLSTTGNSASDFTTTLVAESTTTNSYVEYTADLSSYAGQQGYIAIHHFNCTDQRYLYVDDFGLYGSENWVSVTPNPIDATTTLTGLTPTTDYEWQVQGINCDGNGATTSWSAPATFTTAMALVTLNSWPESIGATLTGGGLQSAGSHTISATAPTGYQFVNWTGTDGNVVSSNANYTFNLTGDITLQANFTKTTVTSLPWTEGFESYTYSGQGLLNGDWATPLRVGSCPNVENYAYGAPSGNYTMHMDQNSSNYSMAVFPQFDQPLNTLLVEFKCARGGSSTTGEGVLGYVTGPSDGSTFVALATMTQPNSVTSYSSYSYNLTTISNAPDNANYRLAIRYKNSGQVWYFDDFSVKVATHTLTASVSPSEGGTISANGTTISGATTYNHGTSVTLTANAATGYTFQNWTIDGSTVANNPTTVTMDQDHTVVANFTHDEYTLTLIADPLAGGTVSASPAGPYHNGDVVTITATANAGYTFSSWSDGGTQSHDVTITGNASYTANFTMMPTWVSHQSGYSSAPSGYSETNGNATISNAEGLAWLISVVNGYKGGGNDFSGKTVTITADIDMNAYIWVPIGTESKPFRGTFDGGYHIISGLRIANAGEIVAVESSMGSAMKYTGLFGFVSGNAVIKNVLLFNSSLSNNYDSDSDPLNNGILGGIAGRLDPSSNAKIEMCETAVTLTALGNITMIGGVVGEAKNVTACMSMSELNYGSYNIGSSVGGVAGGSYSATKDCFANATITKTTGDATCGAVVGTAMGSLTNLYAHQSAAGADKVVYSGSMTNVFAPGSYDSGTETYSSSYASTGYNNLFTGINYTYGADNNLIVKSTGATTGSRMVDTLNKSVSEKFKWIMPHKTHINGGYPIVVRSTEDVAGLMAAVGISGDKKIYYGEANAMITKYGSNGDADIYVYGGGMLTRKPTDANLYIDEDASIKLSGVSNVVATVGVTMDNSKAAVVEGSLLGRDWHCFATPLNEPVLGITYTNETQYTTSSTDNAHIVEGDAFDISTATNSYLAGLVGNADDDLDYYDFYEPQYHWINLKRNKNSHWHQDNGEQIFYDQGSVMQSGKGYLIAVGNNTAAKRNVYLSATGTLKDGDVTATVTNKGEHLTGYNFLGNPYQSYLDFNEFASVEANAKALWSNTEAIGYKSYLIYDADQGGFVEYLVDNSSKGFSQGAEIKTNALIHPHQSFFVVKNSTTNDTETVTFTNDMRVTDTTGYGLSAYRSIPSYPLVNLICTDDNGKREVSVIELDRPEMAGALKMKDMMNGKANMYIRWNNEDFSSMFIEGTPDYVPVWFKSNEEGIFTMTWSTANDNFGYLHLIDNLTGNDIDMLATDSYAFQSRPSDSKARFRLVFSPLGIDEETSEQGENFAFINGNELVVTGEGELSLIDLNGRVLTTEYVSGQQSHIAMPKVAVGMYMLRLSNSDGVKVQKIVVRK